MLLPQEILIAHILPDCDDKLVAVNRFFFTFITGFTPDQISCEGFDHPPASKAAQYLSRGRTIAFQRHNHINKIPSFIWYSRVTEVVGLPLDYEKYLEGTRIHKLKLAERQLGNGQENVIRLAHLLANNTNVTALALWGNQTEDAGAQVLALNTTLKSLDLKYNQVGDAGAQALALNTTLTSLNLRNNQVGNVGAQALARNTTLITLNLGANQVNVAGVQALAQNTTLTNLCLLMSQVGDVGAEALARNTTLTNLNVELARIQEAGEKALRANTTLKMLIL